MRIPPVWVALDWPTPNYVDPPTRGDSLLIVNIICIILVTIAVAGRLYSRLVLRSWYGVDDTMIILAFICTIGMTIVVLLAEQRYGWDRHIYDVPQHMIPQANQIAFAAKIVFTLAATFTRLSLLCFYYRLIAKSGMKWFTWVLHFGVVWVISVCLSFLFLGIFLCIPVRAYWEYPQPAHMTCLDEGKVLLGGGIVNSASDLLVTVLPIPMVMKLQMPIRQRIGVCVLLCFGVIVTVAGAVRTYYTWYSFMKSWDETWWSYWLWLAAAVEINLGVICACAPAWKSLLQVPIENISSKLSSRLSSNRQNSNSDARSSTTPKKSFVSLPLRSLPWFHHDGFDFERRRNRRNRENRADSMEERVVREPVELADYEDSSRQTSAGDRTIDLFGRSGDRKGAMSSKSHITESSWSIGEGRKPKLQITKEHTFEQSSARIGTSSSTESQFQILPPKR